MSSAQSEITEYRGAERLNHGLYGLVMITATLVAEQEHVDSVGDALGSLLGTAAGASFGTHLHRRDG